MSGLLERIMKKQYKQSPVLFLMKQKMKLKSYSMDNIHLHTQTKRDKEKQEEFECDLEIQHIINGSTDSTIDGYFRVDGDEEVVDRDIWYSIPVYIYSSECSSISDSEEDSDSFESE